MHNPANRRIRTRMSGGVGGEEPRGSPLSRFKHAPDASRLDIHQAAAGAAPWMSDRADNSRSICPSVPTVIRR